MAKQEAQLALGDPMRLSTSTAAAPFPISRMPSLLRQSHHSGGVLGLPLPSALPLQVELLRRLGTRGGSSRRHPQQLHQLAEEVEEEEGGHLAGEGFAASADSGRVAGAGLRAIDSPDSPLPSRMRQQRQQQWLQQQRQQREGLEHRQGEGDGGAHAHQE